jgi:hypothetical protein
MLWMPMSNVGTNHNIDNIVRIKKRLKKLPRPKQ